MRKIPVKKIVPDYIRPFAVHKVNRNLNYTVKDDYGNQKRLFLLRARSFRANKAHNQTTTVFPELQHLSINLDTEPIELINPEEVAETTPFSDRGDV